jgi:hypothetical protein
MLDLVPLACAWRKVAYMDAQPYFINQSLQFKFPCTCTVSVAAPSVGCDENFLCIWVSWCVMITSNADPCFVSGHIEDTVRNRLSKCIIRKVVNVDPSRTPRRLPLSTCIPEISDEFLLLRINGDDWLVSCLKVLEARALARVTGLSDSVLIASAWYSSSSVMQFAMLLSQPSTPPSHHLPGIRFFAICVLALNPSALSK